MRYEKVRRIGSLFIQVKVYFIPVTASYYFEQQYQSGQLYAQLGLAFYRYFQPEILKVLNDCAFSMQKGLTYITNSNHISLYHRAILMVNN